MDEFLESDSQDGCQAILALSITLMAEHETDMDQKILLQKSYQMNRPCKHKNPGALAEAMSHAMSKASEKIIKDVLEKITDHQ